MMTRKDIAELVKDEMDEQFPNRGESEEDRRERQEYEAISYAEGGPQPSEFYCPATDGLSPEERQQGIVPFHVALEEARDDERRNS